MKEPTHLTDAEMAWMKRAACRLREDAPAEEKDARTALFFVGAGESQAPAKAFCAVCPVKDECLDFALANNIHHGLWGGCSERERRQIRKRQRIKRSA